MFHQVARASQGPSYELVAACHGVAAIAELQEKGWTQKGPGAPGRPWVQALPVCPPRAAAAWRWWIGDDSEDLEKSRGGSARHPLQGCGLENVGKVVQRRGSRKHGRAGREVTNQHGCSSVCRCLVGSREYTLHELGWSERTWLG